jgi:hypothetical protein
VTSWAGQAMNWLQLGGGPAPAPNFEGRRVMRAPPTQFTRTASVRLDAAGYGYCTVWCPNGVRWEIDSTSISTSISRTLQVPQPICTLYKDSAPNPGGFLENTYNGDNASSNTAISRIGGQPLTAEWYSDANAAPSHAGLIATLVVAGLQYQVMA